MGRFVHSDVTRCIISSGGRGEKELKDEERGKRQHQETGGAGANSSCHLSSTGSQSQKGGLKFKLVVVLSSHPSLRIWQNPRRAKAE